MSLIVPAQPASEFYDFSALALTAERSRQPGDPPYNPAHKIKRWEGGGGSTQLFVDVLTGAVTPVSISADEDGVNFLPDAYAPWDIGPDWYLSRLMDAMGVYISIGGIAMNNGGRPSIGDRANYIITLPGGQQVAAGVLLASKNARGVGHPGHWGVDPATTLPMWINDPDAAVGDTAAWGVPIRPLLDGEVPEVMSVTLFGTTWHVHNTLLAKAPPSGGGMTSVQEHKLDLALRAAQDALAGVQAIRKALGQ